MNGADKNPALEAVKFKGFTFVKLSDVLPQIPAFLCCNGAHEAVGKSNGIRDEYYPVESNQSSVLETRHLQKAQQGFQITSLTQNAPKAVQNLSRSPQIVSKPEREIQQSTPFVQSNRPSFPKPIPSVAQKRDSFLKPDEPAAKKGKKYVDDSLSDFDDFDAELWGVALTPRKTDDKQNNTFKSCNSSFGQVNRTTTSDFSFGQWNSMDYTDYEQSITSNSLFGQTNTPNSTFGQTNTPNSAKVNTNFVQQESTLTSYQSTPSFGQQQKVLQTTRPDLNANLTPQHSTRTYAESSARTYTKTPFTNYPRSSTSSKPTVPSVIRPAASSSDDLKPKFKSFLKDDMKQFCNDALLSYDMRSRMYHILRNVFGFREFRFCQQGVIIATLLGHNCFVMMPSGAGKSLCYQLTALLSDGLTLVISPLISLMTDQVAKLKSLKIKTELLCGDTKEKTRETIFADLNADVKLKLLYVTPEMLSKSNTLTDTLDRLQKNGKLSRIVVDEAHCISSWGHDFRTEYSNLPSYFKSLHGVPFMALTATATPQAVVDIRQSLKIENSAFFISSFVRNNLSYDIMPKSAANMKKIIKFLKEEYTGTSGIFYCLSRQDCEDVAKQLTLAGIKSLPYHSKLGSKAKEITQNRWMNNDVSVICATIAFGMGIDKPDVRFVIHHSMPSSIEDYYNETGRAGRDGLPSRCTLLYSFADHVRYLKLFEKNKSTSFYQEQRIKNLNKMIAYCENVTTCHRKLLVEHFGEVYDSEDCKKAIALCRNCRQPNKYKAYDFTEEAVEVLKSIEVMNRNKTTQATMKTVIGSYRGIEGKSKGAKACLSLPLFKRGEGCSQDDVKRFVHKLLAEGYVSEYVENNPHLKIDICYINLTTEGKKFMNSKEPKFYSCLSGLVKRCTNTSLCRMKPVPIATVLKEKYKLKNIEVFNEAKMELTKLLQSIVFEETDKYGNIYNIISSEGLEQLAATLPRTESEFLDIDSMNPDKYQIYGSRIMPIMRKYQKKIDEYEHNSIKETLSMF